MDAHVIEGIRPQVIVGLPWIQQKQPQVEWNDAGTLLFPNGGRWRAEESYTEKYNKYNNVIPTAVHGICINDEGGTSEELYNTQEMSVPSWISGVTKLYHGIFDPLSGMPPESHVRHAIHLIPRARPVLKRPYRLSASQKESAEKQILQGLQEGWLQPSTSAWGTVILIVPKKDNTWRIYVDYRDLNVLTVADAYLLPRIDDLLHRLGRAKYFTKLDLQSEYHEIWIELEDHHKTAFRIGEPVNGYCHFE